MSQNTANNDIISALSEFDQPAVRDLAWVMRSPSLIDEKHYASTVVTAAECHQHYHRQLEWLRSLDREPQPLLDALAARKPSSALGVYFEALVAFWLRHLPDVSMLACNLPVIEDGRHLGEFDFIFDDRQCTEVRHWEVAVKFYLRLGKPPYQWLGPNAQDTLHKKLDRLFKHQLPLAQTQAGQQTLHQHFAARHIRSAAFIKGYLFYPLETYMTDQGWTDCADNAVIATDHLSGWWSDRKSLSIWIRQQPPSDYWCVLPRLEWLAPKISHSAKELLDHKTLIETVQSLQEHRSQAVLLCQLRQQRGLWIEISRGFVVPDQWPET